MTNAIFDSALQGANRSRQNLPPAVRDIDINRLFRAFVSQDDWRRPELTAFVEASSRESAVKKIAGIIALIEFRKAEEITERIYNLTSAEELIAENISEEPAKRLFETGWSGGKVTCWVRAPLVLTPNPGPLLAVWAHIMDVRK